jgi:hypothetical protein
LQIIFSYSLCENFPIFIGLQYGARHVSFVTAFRRGGRSVKILLVDDHAVIRAGGGWLLTSEVVLQFWRRIRVRELWTSTDASGLISSFLTSIPFFVGVTRAMRRDAELDGLAARLFQYAEKHPTIQADLLGAGQIAMELAAVLRAHDAVRANAAKKS